jgi:putative endonuclease
MGNNVKLGAYGESIACKYLEDKGFKIIQKNYRCTIGEIDIIIEDKEYLVFVEVKYRRSLKFGHPREAVGVKKQLNIKNIAANYIKSKEIKNKDIRFDIIEIIHIKEINIEHIKNAF